MRGFKCEKCHGWFEQDPPITILAYRDIIDCCASCGLRLIEKEFGYKPVDL